MGILDIYQDMNIFIVFCVLFNIVLFGSFFIIISIFYFIYPFIFFDGVAFYQTSDWMNTNERRPARECLLTSIEPKASSEEDNHN